MEAPDTLRQEAANTRCDAFELPREPLGDAPPPQRPAAAQAQREETPTARGLLGDPGERLGARWLRTTFPTITVKPPIGGDGVGEAMGTSRHPGVRRAVHIPGPDAPRGREGSGPAPGSYPSEAGVSLLRICRRR